MNNRQIIAPVLIVLATAILTTVWWIGRPASGRQRSAEESRVPKPPPSPAVGSDMQRPAQNEDSSARPAGHKMSDLEFKRFKVS